MRQSATLAINERLQARRAAGEDVLHLAFGEAGLPVLPEVGEVLAASAQRNQYGPVAGSLAARTAAAGYFTRRGLPTEPDQVLLAPGSKPLLFAALAALPGDVVLPQPSWVSYAAQAALLGRRVIGVPIAEEAGGVPDPDALEESLAARGGDGGVLVLTMPDNPTGTVASAPLVRRVCAVAERHGLHVVSDEIYRDLCHPGVAVESPALHLPERTVVTGGLSKNMALGGYRIGFARVPRGELLRTMSAVASEVWSSMASPMHEVAAWVLDEPPAVRDHVAASVRLHHAVSHAVHAELVAGGASCRPPQAAFYCYPDLEVLRPSVATTGAALAEVLLERHGVGVLPGEAFGDDPAGLRMRVASSLLYGDTPERRWQALRSQAPLELAWIAASLSRLREALAAVAQPRQPGRTSPDS